MKPRLTIRDHNEIVRRARTGESYKKIAKDFDRSSKRIGFIGRSAGIIRRHTAPQVFSKLNLDCFKGDKEWFMERYGRGYTRKIREVLHDYVTRQQAAQHLSSPQGKAPECVKQPHAGSASTGYRPFVAEALADETSN